ncbi:MAG: hypothetical protein ACP5HF_02155 [Candidatus Micrarchaeia archaeon]
MMSLLFSLGAINAFIPLIIILILIVAAAGLMRGYNIFALLGLSALLGGAGRGTLANKQVSKSTDMVRKNAPLEKKLKSLNKKAGSKIVGAVSYTKQIWREYILAMANGVPRMQALKIARENVSYRIKVDKIGEKQKIVDNLNNNINNLKASATYSTHPAMKNLFTNFDPHYKNAETLSKEIQNLQTKLESTYDPAKRQLIISDLNSKIKSYNTEVKQIVKTIEKGQIDMFKRMAAGVGVGAKGLIRMSTTKVPSSGTVINELHVMREINNLVKLKNKIKNMKT